MHLRPEYCSKVSHNHMSYGLFIYNFPGLTESCTGNGRVNFKCWCSRDYLQTFEYPWFTFGTSSQSTMVSRSCTNILESSIQLYIEKKYGCVKDLRIVPWTRKSYPLRLSIVSKKTKFYKPPDNFRRKQEVHKDQCHTSNANKSWCLSKILYNG